MGIARRPITAQRKGMAFKWKPKHRPRGVREGEGLPQPMPRPRRRREGSDAMGVCNGVINKGR